MFGLTFPLNPVGPKMVWMLICIGILTLLIVYGFFPSTELYIVLILLSLLLAILAIGVIQTLCCGTTEVQNLQPVLKPKSLESSPSTAASKACWGRFGGNRTRRSKKENPKKKASPGCESVSSESTALAEHRERVQPGTFEVGSVLPFECLAGEVTAENYPDVVARGESICVVMEDDHSGYSRVVLAGIVDETREAEVPDDDNLFGVATTVEVVVEEKQASKTLKDLGPVLDHRRGLRPRVFPGYLSTYI